jgi:hypothetical protein
VKRRQHSVENNTNLTLSEKDERRPKHPKPKYFGIEFGIVTSLIHILTSDLIVGTVI